MLDRETPAERLRIARQWFRLSMAGGAPFTTRTATNFDLLLGSIEADLGRHLLPADRALALAGLIERWSEGARQLRVYVRSMGAGEVPRTDEAVALLDRELEGFDRVGRLLVDELLALNGLELVPAAEAPAGGLDTPHFMSTAHAMPAMGPTLKETAHG